MEARRGSCEGGKGGGVTIGLGCSNYNRGGVAAGGGLGTCVVLAGLVVGDGCGIQVVKA